MKLITKPSPTWCLWIESRGVAEPSACGALLVDCVTPGAVVRPGGVRIVKRGGLRTEIDDSCR